MTLYQKGCPRDNNPHDPGLTNLGSVAGAAGRDMFCYRLSGGHSAFLKNIKEAGMKVVAYSNWGCTNEIETWKEDGCVVVNAGKHVSFFFSFLIFTSVERWDGMG